jgi:hypothetical protein
MWWVTLVDLVWDHVGGNFQGRVEHFIFGFDAKYGLKHTTPLQPEEKVLRHLNKVTQCALIIPRNYRIRASEEVV